MSRFKPKMPLAVMAALASLFMADPAFADRDHDHDDDRGGWNRHDHDHDRSRFVPQAYRYGFQHGNKTVYYRYPSPIVAYKPVYVNDDLRRSCHFTVDPWGPDFRGRVRGYWSEGCYQPVRYIQNDPGVSFNFLFD